MTPITRRRLLAASLAGTGAALAGCTGSGDSDDESGDEDAEGDDQEEAEEEEPAVPMLHEVGLANRHDDPHTIHVLVERAGEIVHWSSTDLDSDGVATVERTWDEEPGAFVISGRMDDQAFWEQIDLTKERSLCYGIVLEITEEGVLDMRFRQNPDDCDHPDPDAGDDGS